MLRKKKITRKRSREGKKLLKKIFIFFSIFAVTLGALLLVFRQSGEGLLSPLSFAKNIAADKHDVRDTKAIKAALNAKKIAFDEVKISSDGAYMVKLKTGEDLILSPKKDIAQQLSSLQVIYSRLTMEGRGLRKLDFRYDKPVVVFK